MKRIYQMLFCVLCALVVQAAAAETQTPALPNVVLIYIDDLGYGDVGCYGCKDIPTPNIDRLATEGVRFTASYITNPPCCPSRCSLMMGQYAPREETDLAAKHSDVVKQMSAKHAAWTKTLSPLGKIPEIPDTAQIVPAGHGWAYAPPKGRAN